MSEIREGIVVTTCNIRKKLLRSEAGGHLKHILGCVLPLVLSEVCTTVGEAVERLLQLFPNCQHLAVACYGCLCELPTRRLYTLCNYTDNT